LFFRERKIMFKVFKNADTGGVFAINIELVLDVFEGSRGDKAVTIICAQNGEQWCVDAPFSEVVQALNSNAQFVR
jgi:hypothetical protein